MTRVYCPACKGTMDKLNGLGGTEIEYSNYYCSDKEKCRKIQDDTIRHLVTLLKDKNQALKGLTSERISKLDDKDGIRVAKFSRISFTLSDSGPII